MAASQGFFSESRLHELLAAVDVVGCAGYDCVGHEVDCQGGDVRWAYHAPDRKRRAELLAPARALASASIAAVIAAISAPAAGWRPPRFPHEDERPSRANFLCSITSNVHRQK